MAPEPNGGDRTATRGTPLPPPEPPRSTPDAACLCPT